VLRRVVSQDSLEISIARKTRLKVQIVAVAYLDWTSEDSSRSTSGEQNSCLETRKIHIFDYNLSPVGREAVKCIVGGPKVGWGPWRH